LKESKATDVEINAIDFIEKNTFLNLFDAIASKDTTTAKDMICDNFVETRRIANKIRILSK
jgi:hypothetical protein